jgi:hypothetical protein
MDYLKASDGERAYVPAGSFKRGGANATSQVLVFTLP